MVRQNTHSIDKHVTFGGLEIEIVPICAILPASGVRHREHVLWNTMTISTISKLAVHCIKSHETYLLGIVYLNHPSFFSYNFNQ
jgi:hypothetical protein